MRPSSITIDGIHPQRVHTASVPEHTSKPPGPRQPYGTDSPPFDNKGNQASTLTSRPPNQGPASLLTPGSHPPKRATSLTQPSLLQDQDIPLQARHHSIGGIQAGDIRRHDHHITNPSRARIRRLTNPLAPEAIASHDAPRGITRTSRLATRLITQHRGLLLRLPPLHSNRPLRAGMRHHSEGHRAGKVPVPGRATTAHHIPAPNTQGSSSNPMPL